MPTVLFLFGIRFFFYPNDHEPIHVHIEYQGNAAKFQVAPEMRLMENHGIKASALKKAMELIAIHKDMIIREWQKSFDNRN